VKGEGDGIAITTTRKRMGENEKPTINGRQDGNMARLSVVKDDPAAADSELRAKDQREGTIMTPKGRSAEKIKGQVKKTHLS